MAPATEVQIFSPDTIYGDPRAFNETEVTARAKQGDEQAFTELYNQFYPYVRAVAYSKSNDRNAIEDIVQMTLAKAFNKIENFQEGNFRGWLATITERTIIDLHRYNHRRSTNTAEELAPDTLLLNDSPANNIDQFVGETALADYLNKLEPNYRQAFLAIEVLGMAYEEWAEASNTPIGTVKSRLSRAKEKLAHLITADEHIV